MRTKHLQSLPTSITIGNAQIPFKQSVKNLGFTLDCQLTMNAHASIITRTCYLEKRRLASIRRFLTSTATATLVSAFVFSRIDYCNSLKVVNDLFLSLNKGNISVLALFDFFQHLIQLTILSLYIVYILTLDLLILSFNGFHLI